MTTAFDDPDDDQDDDDGIIRSTNRELDVFDVAAALGKLDQINDRGGRHK